jgi:hypothetical protein
MPPESWPNTGVMFWVYVTTIPLTLIAVANLIAAWIYRSIRRKWWLSAAVIVMLERLATFSYFIPTMINLTSSNLPDPEINEKLSQWLFFNHGSYLGEVVDGAQSIIVSGNYRG